MKRAVSRRSAKQKAASPGSRVRRKHVHGHVVLMFGGLAVLLLLLNIAIVLTPSRNALATSLDNIAGWAWSDTGGWLSLNDTNSGSGGGTYGVTVDINTSAVTGYAWSNNQGWTCFGTTCSVACPGGSPPSGGLSASIDASNRLRGWAKFCNLGDNGWISLNCLDAPGGCAPSYGPTVNYGTGAFSGFAWHGLSGAQGWGWIDFAQVRISAPPETVCTDTLDNDLDGNADCDDNDCSAEPVCNPETGDILCTNEIDDDADTDIDCLDSGCSTVDACTKPWLQAQYGSIYGQQGVGGNPAPTSTGQVNATYCISSAGTITSFTSAEGCLEASASPLSLPTGGNGYVSNIGRLDVPGILSGRYGAVVSISSDAGLPSSLAGRIYLYDRDAQGGTCPSSGPNGAGTAFVLNAKTFNNANGSTGRGNGLLAIKGCDLVVMGNSGYQAAGVSTYLRNLSSFGAVVLAKYVGGVPVNGGNMYIDSSVTQIVGLYFGERSIHSGSTGGTFTDVPLLISGALVSRDLQFERRFGSQTQAAENVVFDARGVVNPPPGMQDITKSLPSLQDTY